MDCQVSDNGDYGVVLDAILDSCHSLQKLSFGTTSEKLNLSLNLSIFYRICLQNGKSLKTLYLPNCKGLDMKMLKMIVDNCKSLIEVDFSSTFSKALSEKSIDFLFDNLSTDIEQLFLRGQNENSYNEFNMTRLLGRCSKLRKLDIEYIHTRPWTNRVFQNLPHLNPHKNKKLPYEWPYIPVKMLRHWIWDVKSDQVNLFQNQGYWRYLQGRLLLDM